MPPLTRRQFVVAAPLAAAGAALAPACTPGPDAVGRAAAAERQAGAGSPAVSAGAALQRELVRHATLAPSSHNTQCWTFGLGEDAIVLRADRTRLCPAVDPDEHHVWVSLGCATENLVQAALAHGRRAEVRVDATDGAIRLALTPVTATESPLFRAIAGRQCSRNDYDGRALSASDLASLERAGSSEAVRLLFVTGQPAMERVLAYVIEANTAQMADPLFVRELRDWVRFNGAEALATGDGLSSATTGNPAVPTWLGRAAFGWLYRRAPENDKCARQLRSSAGLAVFVGRSVDRASWVEVGRCYERFALQATALGIRTAFLNQPVEVASVREPFAASLGLANARPDLVVRFGHGPLMPYSLRRPVPSVLV